MNGMAPSRTRRIDRLRTRPGLPSELPPKEDRRCQLCDCRLSGYNPGRLCACCDDKMMHPTEDPKRKIEREKYAQIVRLRDVGWTWPEIGFLVDANPNYLNSVINKYKREQA